jgi:hypothetical protein
MKISAHKHVWTWQYNKILDSILTKQLLTTKFQNTKLKWISTFYVML